MELEDGSRKAELSSQTPDTNLTFSTAKLIKNS